MSKKSVSRQGGLPILHERAAGIDIGSRFHVVAVAPGLTDQPVQTFQAFTADLQRMADWLDELAHDAPVLNSTPVAVVGKAYWPLPWYLRGFDKVGYYDVLPVDANHRPLLLLVSSLRNRPCRDAPTRSAISHLDGSGDSESGSILLHEA